MTAAGILKVAIIDDDPEIRRALCQMLEIEGWDPVAFADAETALGHVGADFLGIVVSDLRMPGLDGNGVFTRLNRCDPELPVIMMSGHGDIATAVDLVRRGAYDFLPKPFDGDAMIATMRRALEKRVLVLENRRLRNTAAIVAKGTLLGESPEIEVVRQTLAHLAHTDIDVLISGESGVGKSLIANELHRRSPRARKAVIRIDCSTIAGDQAESLLFGHVSGAIAGAQFPRTGQLVLANGSTLLLDRVDGLPRSLQSRLQQALEGGHILPVGAAKGQESRFRTISTTGVDLEALVVAGRFERSLYFRLGAFRLTVPPLRERRGDAIVLFRAFLVEAARDLGREPPSVSPSIWRRLNDDRWPGNVRELKSFAANVALGLDDTRVSGHVGAADRDQPGLKEATAAFEADMIRTTLDRTGGDIASALAILRLPRKTLYDKLARHAIDPRDFRPVRARRQGGPDANIEPRDDRTKPS